MMWPLGIERKIATVPNAISPSSAQDSVRAQAERSLLVALPYAPQPATNAAVAPAACHRAGGSFAALRGGDVKPEDACDRADEQPQPGPAAEIATDVGPERGESDRHCDIPHDVAEEP